jgi:predicted CXXCH cytochrome family protein
MIKSTRMVLFFSALCAFVLLTAGPGWAGIGGSRHDLASTSHAYSGLRTLAKWGQCSACHFPHNAGADRLFPSAATGVTGGFFGPLCATCHHTNGYAAGTVNIAGDNSIFSTTAHGLDIADYSGQADAYTAASTGTDYSTASTLLAYTSQAASPRATKVPAIECLSCHDVHNQKQQRPFLMVSLSTLCQECHTNRINNDTANSGYANDLSGGGSTHPSGPAFSGDLGDSSGVANLGGANSPLNLAFIVSNTDTGSDGSTWADAVWDSGAHREGTGVGCVTCHNVHWNDNALLTPAGPQYLGIIADNNGGDNNTFCEACHQGSTTGSSGTYYWNPGAIAGVGYSHPNDDVGATTLSFAVQPILGPTTTSAKSGTGASTLVCTGCHGVHRGSAADASRETETNTPILLNYNDTTYDTVCDACHAGSALGFNHHPTGGSVYATSGNTAGNVSCNGGDTEGYTTCHGGGNANNGDAHNRASVLGAGINTNNSAMCVRCHTVNPSTYTGQVNAGTYTVGGLASHFVGDTGATTWKSGRTTGTSSTIRAAGADAGNTNWTGSGLPSKWGANATTIICESCHRLRSGNLQTGDGATRMLVEIAGSARVTVSATSAAGSTQYSGATYLCTGCHLVPAGTHPLLNANAAKYGIASPAGQSYTGGTNSGSVNCESCHSAHNAQTVTGSYILDGNNTGSGTTGMEVEPTINYTGFCATCHGTFQ